MIKITYKKTNLYAKTTSRLEKLKKLKFDFIVEKYAKLGVDALSSATPVDSGKTANSWSYTITKGQNGSRIDWSNSNVESGGTSIALLIQYGHATGTGGFIPGRDYINPALNPLVKQMGEEIRKEVGQ